jgi:DNA-binding NarL/FixJ family response regulator
MNVLLLCDDLLFSSRVTGTAATHALVVRVCRSAEELVQLAREHRPGCVILDLSHTTLHVPQVVGALRALAPSPRIVAYGSHVDVETLKAARTAGCDIVMPRSQFVEMLPKLLPEWVRR